MDQNQWKRVKQIPIFMLGVLLLWGIDFAIRGPNAKRRQSAIENDLRVIPDPGSSHIINSTSGFKTSGGWTNRILRTDLAPDDVAAYYRDKLEEQHWYYMRDKTILSKRRFIFCGGNDDAAVLVVPETVSSGSYEYSLTITWGNTEGCS